MKQQTDLGQGSVGKLLIKLAIPAIAAQLVNALYNMVDRMYIGRIEGVGSLALTGVGLCFPIIMLISAFSSFVGMGGAPIIRLQNEKGKKSGRRGTDSRKRSEHAGNIIRSADACIFPV